MLRPPPGTTRTEPLFPYTTRVRSWHAPAVHRRATGGTTCTESGCCASCSPVRWHPLPRAWSIHRLQDSPSTIRSEEHTSELQSLIRISYAVFCLKKTLQLTYLITHTYTHSYSNQHTYYICKT